MPRDGEEMPSRGQNASARKGQWNIAKARQPKAGRKGHERRADKAGEALPSAPQPNERAKGRRSVADTASAGLPPRAQPQGEAGHKDGAETANQQMPSLADRIAAIRAWHRRRVFAMDQRKRADLALGSFLRVQLGWRKDAPDEERKEIALLAAALIDTEEKALKAEAKGKTPILTTESQWADVIRAAILARAPFDAIESQATKEMERIAATLAVWPWGEKIKGFGPRSLAVIVAEAGDLAHYPKKGHLWKRLGLAVIGDKRQGAPGKNASKEEWIAHGYNKRRRSMIFASLVQPLTTKPGKYRDIYLARKAYEQARAPEGMSKMHIHRRAHRYMEKMFLRDLWKEWRRVTGQKRRADEADRPLPALAA